jgi:hypothetical protein
MKRAGMIVFHAAAAVSLLLLIAGTELWGNSDVSQYTVTRYGRSAMQHIAISQGELMVLVTSGLNPGTAEQDAAGQWRWETRRPAVDPEELVMAEFPIGRRPVAGFFFARGKTTSRSGAILLLPMPFVLSLFTLLPLVELLRYRRHRRRRDRVASGRCAGCGYDLRESPGKCPECGAAPSGAERLWEAKE